MKKKNSVPEEPGQGKRTDQYEKAAALAIVAIILLIAFVFLLFVVIYVEPELLSSL